ncbi:MAG TPA: hypothetical protein VF595_06205 [Tepidisphaeraceae bacterium]|jgi:hypothetical protein
MTRIICESADARPARWPMVPAGVALAAIATMTLSVVLAGATPDVTTLRSKAEQAVARKDDRTAALHYRHLLALQPQQPAHAFALAEAIDRTGRRGEAMAVLGTIAPISGDGYAPAHLRQAEWLVEARVLRGASDAATLTAARAHATAAARDDKTRSAANGLLDILGEAPAGSGP